MKKGFIAGAALALAIAAPVTVFAEEGVPSSTTDDTTIVITPMDENAGIQVGDSAAVLNEKWGTDLEAEYTVIFVGEAQVTVDGKVVENYGPGVSKTFNASDPLFKSEFGDGELLVHLKSSDNKPEVGPTLTLKSEDLSPIVAVKWFPFGGDDGNAGDGSGSGSGSGNAGSGSGTANTGDSNNTGLWAGALIVSALLAGAAFVMNKRNA